jgi:NAD(P)-dependent dehydrogenase (short-subunit alcohol dehydrogenase family)
MNKPTAYIITGATRGIGLCLAKAVTDGGDRFFAISRAPGSPNPKAFNYTCDLSVARLICIPVLV